MIFITKYVFRLVFEGDIFGGARIKLWGNPYLNSTTVLFDTWKCYNGVGPALRQGSRGVSSEDVIID